MHRCCRILREAFGTECLLARYGNPKQQHNKRQWWKFGTLLLHTVLALPWTDLPTVSDVVAPHSGLYACRRYQSGRLLQALLPSSPSSLICLCVSVSVSKYWTVTINDTNPSPLLRSITQQWTQSSHTPCLQSTKLPSVLTCVTTTWTQSMVFLPSKFLRCALRYISVVASI